VLGYLGRLSAEKDPYAVARAIAHLPREWVGVLVGDGDEASQCRADAMVQAPGRVFFPGPTNDIGSALHAMDVLLVPSLQEGFGLTIVEGWMAGVQTLATPVGVADDVRLSRLMNVWHIRPGESGDEIAETISDMTLGGCRKPREPDIRPFREHELSASAFARRWENFLERIWADAQHPKLEQSHA
jgi:glycosyltransferase involved in cell wall biosynthesis